MVNVFGTYLKIAKDLSTYTLDQSFHSTRGILLSFVDVRRQTTKEEDVLSVSSSFRKGHSKSIIFCHKKGIIIFRTRHNMILRLEMVNYKKGSWSDPLNATPFSVSDSKKSHKYPLKISVTGLEIDTLKSSAYSTRGSPRVLRWESTEVSSSSEGTRT